MDIGRGAEPPGIHLPQELGEIDYAGAAHQQKDVPGPEAFGFAFSQKAPFSLVTEAKTTITRFVESASSSERERTLGSGATF